jgi:hypothetical protein
MTVLCDDLCARYEFYLHIISFFIKGFQFPLASAAVLWEIDCEIPHVVEPRAESHAACVCQILAPVICWLLANSGVNYYKKLLTGRPPATFKPVASLQHYIWLKIFRENGCVMLASNLRNTTLSPCQDFFQNINMKKCLRQWRGSHNKFPSNAATPSFFQQQNNYCAGRLSFSFPLSAFSRRANRRWKNERNKPANPLTFFKYLNDIGLRQTRGEERRFFHLTAFAPKERAGARVRRLPARERTAEKLTAIPLYPCTAFRVCSLRLVSEADEPLFPPPPPTLAALLATWLHSSSSLRFRARTRPAARFTDLISSPCLIIIHFISRVKLMLCAAPSSFHSI